MEIQRLWILLRLSVLDRTCQRPTSSRQHLHCWRQTLQLRGSVVPAKFSASGIHVISFQNNMDCDVYVRKNLYANVVLSCGTYMFQEVLERMTQELTASAPSAMKIKVSLLAPNPSVAPQCCCSPRLASSQTVTPHCRRCYASVARKCCSHPSFEPQDYNYDCIFRKSDLHAGGPLPSHPNTSLIRWMPAARVCESVERGSGLCQTTLTMTICVCF